MAKAIKPKKEKPIKHTAEATHTETVPISEEGIIEVTTIEPEIAEEPPSVTLDELKAAEEVIEPIKEEPVTQEEIKEFVQNIEPVSPIGKFATESNEELSMEDKIIIFVESRNGEIKLNDFLKSLYGVPKFGEPAAWISQQASKGLRATLSKLSNEGVLNIVSNAHMKLGTFYYPDSVTAKTEYHNLNTVQIICIK